MQFCLLYIDRDTARLSCFESLMPHARTMAEGDSSLRLVWTDLSRMVVESEPSEEPVEPILNTNYILELLDRNSDKVTDPLLVCLSGTLGELYHLSFPFSDSKKIKQVINLELEDILPYDPDFTHTFVSTLTIPNSSNSGSLVKTILLEKVTLQKAIDDILIAGSIAPVFLYQPLVTEKLLANLIDFGPESLLALEYDGANSYLYSSDKSNGLIQERPLVLPTDLAPLKEVLQAHINLGSHSDHQKICIINKSKLDLSNLLDSKHDSLLSIYPNTFLKNAEEYREEMDSLMLSSILTAFAISNELVNESLLDESNVKNLKLFNIREGEFKYRAPFSDFKENLFAEIVPFALTTVFLLLLLVLNYSTPIKEISLIDKESKKLLQEVAPELSSLSGTPLQILSNEIVNLEGQIGGLTSMRSMSPFDWLYKVSKGVKEDIPVILESLSITSTGIVFRGTVPNYPSSGKLDSMLKAMVRANPSLICKGEVNTEQGSSAQKVSITGILELCQ